MFAGSVLRESLLPPVADCQLTCGIDSLSDWITSVWFMEDILSSFLEVEPYLFFLSLRKSLFTIFQFVTSYCCDIISNHICHLNIKHELIKNRYSLFFHLSEVWFFLHGFLEKEMATHSSVLAWRIPGTEQPGGLPSLGSHRVGHD